MDSVKTEGCEGVIRTRIYLYERKPEIRVALPLVARPLKEYTPGSIIQAMENPTKLAPMVLAVYTYGGEANDIKGYYYYEFIGMEVTP